eukprot:6212154-Pleurochrysis_carterae.AAC.2
MQSKTSPASIRFSSSVRGSWTKSSARSRRETSLSSGGRRVSSSTSSAYASWYSSSLGSDRWCSGWSWTRGISSTERGSSSIPAGVGASTSSAMCAQTSTKRVHDFLSHVAGEGGGSASIAL